MTYDKGALAKQTANAETVGLDPVLKRQLETELHAGYAFNAQHAKKFRPFVWVPTLLTIACGLAAIGAIVGSPIVLMDLGVAGPWMQWLLAAIGLTVLTAFFRLVWAAMGKSQSTSEAMADQYNADKVARSSIQ